MAFFFIKFILTNILFSLILGLVLVRINETYFQGRPSALFKKFSNFELILYSLGLGPIFTVLLLYYLMLFLHDYSDIFYLVSIAMVYLVLLTVARKSAYHLLSKIRYTLSSFLNTLKESDIKKRIGTLSYALIILFLFLLFSLTFVGKALKNPLEGHDILVYGNIGKIYYQDKAIVYSDSIYNEKNGFYYIGSPKPAFSLLLTWEMILNHSLKANKDSSHAMDYTFDINFRSISAYYGLLIVFLSVYWLNRRNKYLALLGILVLFSGLRFFLIFINCHMDSYRIFFLLVSWIFLGYSLQKKDNLSFILLGVFSGFAAFAHLIGLVIALINCLAWFLFSEFPMANKLKKAGLLVLVILIFGGLHYFLDIFFGAEWGFITYFLK
jgi:hypothetical protein